eukprot:COSAG06_NODE_6007_length_3158_cov_4.763975_4_plen_83_part_00
MCLSDVGPQERERREADEAKAVAIRERQEAEEAREKAIKERAEAEAAKEEWRQKLAEDAARQLADKMRGQRSPKPPEGSRTE